MSCTTARFRPLSIAVAVLLGLWVSCCRPGQGAIDLGDRDVQAAVTSADAKLRTVRDPQGRFELDLKSLSPVSVDVLPGYVEVVAEVEVQEKLHCFVFEEPIEAGAATSRALDSLQRGTQIEVRALPRIDEIRGEPLVDLQVSYVSTMPPEERGVVATLLLASADFPIVCSYDAPTQVDVELGRREARRAMSSFRMLCKGTGTCPRRSREFQLWRVDGPSTRGFLLNERVHEGTVRFDYSRSATFEFRDRELSTVDQLSVERSEGTGLSLGKWVTLRNGQPELRAQIQRSESTDAAPGAAHEESRSLEHPRQGAFTYRFGVEMGLDRGQDTFVTHAELRSSVQFLDELFLSEVPSRRLVYAPLIRPSGATEVQLVEIDEERRVRIWRGDKGDRCVLIRRGDDPSDRMWAVQERCVEVGGAEADAAPFDSASVVTAELLAHGSADSEALDRASGPNDSP